MKQIIAIILFVISANAYAGGDYYEVLLTEYVEPFEDGNQYHLTLIFTGERIDEDCNSILVKGTYDQKYWSEYERPMSLLGHAQAMEYLSGRVGYQIRFGQIGRGLKKLHDCTYVSRGLFLEPHGKTSVVLSVHEKI